MTAPVLELSDVSVRFGGLQALSGVSFSVAPHEVVAVIGPNGAGKTSLFNVISGVVQPSSGHIRFGDHQIEGRTAHEISALGVRRTFQTGGLFGELSALENVLVGLHSRIDSGPLGLMFGRRKALEAERAATRRARELLDLMGIGHMADHPAASLSGGQQRMVEIVRAIATQPPLLLLDEPAVGLAPPVREQLSTIVRRLADENAMGILLIEHAIELVMNVSNRIVVLNYGEKIADGTPDEVRRDKDVLEAYLGHA